jgi:hypothetical protein
MEIVYTVLCVACLCIGFFVGYKIGKDKAGVIAYPIKKPTLKEKRERQEYEEEVQRVMEKYNTILDNINNYTGSSDNQRKVN